MSHSYLQKYRTFDELMEAVRVDLPTYNAEGVIEPMQLIKVVQHVTYDLGLRIHKEAEAILDVEKNRAKLPDNFYVLNFALLLGESTVTVPVIEGTHREDVMVDSSVELHDNPVAGACNIPVRLTECGQAYQVTETKSYKTYTWKHFHPLDISSSRFVGKNCMNVGCGAANKARIQDGYIYTNFDNAKLYIHYISHLEDEDGNLLVMDHPFLNEYYEYAIKKRILENMIMAGEPVTEMQLGLITSGFSKARNRAQNFVNTPDFGELKQIWEMNRKAMHQRYYSIFQ